MKDSEPHGQGKHGGGDCAVIVFAKAPVPGQVKTRLAPALGQTGAARLALRMLQQALAQAVQANIGPVELCCAPNAGDPILIEAATAAGVMLSEQGEGDLGQRMQRALERRLASHSRALLIGTDCPSLDADRLRQAAQALETRPAVFAPTFDGGYGLVGLSAALLVRGLDAGEPASSTTPGFARLFDDIDWSTTRVMSQTRERLAQLQLDAAELPMMHDIDEPADLAQVPPAWLE
jgi:rSAM/selenodomain-associated transferase 1